MKICRGYLDILPPPSLVSSQSKSTVVHLFDAGVLAVGARVR